VNARGSRLLAELQRDEAYAGPLLRVRAAREAAAVMRGMRKRAGLTQKAIAERLKVSQARISQIESGVLDYLPPLDFIYLFADACGRHVSLATSSDKDLRVEEYVAEARNTEFGREEITREIPSRALRRNLDEHGVVKIGSVVSAGDILVGRMAPAGDEASTSEEKLLRAIFDRKASSARDTSLRLPAGNPGEVVDVTITYGTPRSRVPKVVSVFVAHQAAAAATASPELARSEQPKRQSGKTREAGQG
jgi:transcriptional regulator with XRE-family HTH domain